MMMLLIIKRSIHEDFIVKEKVESSHKKNWVTMFGEKHFCGNHRSSVWRGWMGSKNRPR